MTTQNAGNGQKKAKSDFVVACNSIKFAIKGRLARAHIISTFDYQNKGFPKHSTYLIVDPNDPKVQQLAQAFRNIKQQFYPQMPDLLWSNPIKDGRTPTRPDGEQWQDWQKGNVFIGMSTGVQFPPTALVKDINSPKGYREANVLDEKNFYYDGAEAVVEFAAGGMEGNTKGINLFFNGILGLGTGDRIVIASSGSFNAEEAFGEFLGATASGGALTGNLQGQANVQNQNFNQNNGQNFNGNNGQQNNQNYQQQNGQNFNQNQNGNMNGNGQNFNGNNGQNFNNNNYNGNGGGSLV